MMKTICIDELSFSEILIGGEFVILSCASQIDINTKTPMKTICIAELSLSKILIGGEFEILSCASQIDINAKTTMKAMAIDALSLSIVSIGGEFIIVRSASQIGIRTPDRSEVPTKIDSMAAGTASLPRRIQTGATTALRFIGRAT
jgi:hypothetical protein